jgi:hypothetical protein
MVTCVKNFYQLKNIPQNKDLDINIINFILDSFDNNDSKKSKKFSLYKKNNIIQKNNKVKISKDKISNKVKLILNKLSQNNINSLILEFIQNIKICTIEDYNDFLKTMYNKILSEISFVKVYLTFLKYIACIYNRLLKFNISYFIGLIENKFMSDYFNSNNNEFCEEYNENYRVNNLNLIREMVTMDFFDNSIIEFINTKILSQNIYLADIYYWFKDNQIDTNIATSIKNILNNHQDIEIRDKILLQNIIAPFETESETKKKNKIVFKKKTHISFDDNVIDLLNNYLVNDNYIHNIKSFIELSCKEISEKNKFSEIMLNMYLSNNYNCILELVEELINNQVLFKSNISKGLINIYNNNSELLNKNNRNEQELINKLKILGITKNLEFLIDKYNHNYHKQDILL